MIKKIKVFDIYYLMKKYNLNSAIINNINDFLIIDFDKSLKLRNIYNKLYYDSYI